MLERRPSSPLALTDEELTAVFNAARPLAPVDRDAFLQQVATELQRHNGDHGPGDVNRAIRSAQKLFFDPPELRPGKPGMRKFG